VGAGEWSAALLSRLRGEAVAERRAFCEEVAAAVPRSAKTLTEHERDEITGSAFRAARRASTPLVTRARRHRLRGIERERRRPRRALGSRRECAASEIRVQIQPYSQTVASVNGQTVKHVSLARGLLSIEFLLRPHCELHC
jgi:hypothetical protein